MIKLKSMTDVAYKILEKRKHGLAFSKLYEKVATKLEFDENKKRAKIAQFYTDLSLDKRFSSLKDNKWELTSHLKFEQTYINTDEYNLDDEEDEIENIDEEDNFKKEDEEYLEEEFEDIKKLKKEIKPELGI